MYAQTDSVHCTPAAKGADEGFGLYDRRLIAIHVHGKVLLWRPRCKTIIFAKRRHSFSPT
jgi:hypothetical protein